MRPRGTGCALLGTRERRPRHTRRGLGAGPRLVLPRAARGWATPGHLAHPGRAQVRRQRRAPRAPPDCGRASLSSLARRNSLVRNAAAWQQRWHLGKSLPLPAEVLIGVIHFRGPGAPRQPPHRSLPSARPPPPARSPPGWRPQSVLVGCLDRDSSHPLVPAASKLLHPWEKPIWRLSWCFFSSLP